MSELHSLVEWLTQTVGEKRTRVADLVEVELSRINSVITAALTESEQRNGQGSYMWHARWISCPSVSWFA